MDWSSSGCAAVSFVPLLLSMDNSSQFGSFDTT